MSSKIVVLVRVRDGKILELRIKSVINKKKFRNKSDFTCSYLFQKISQNPGFPKMQDLDLLEDTARYASLLIAPAEGFVLWQKKELIMLFWPILAIFGVQ